MFPVSPDPLPGDLQALIDRFAATWQQSPARPRISEAVLTHWDELIEAWIGDPDLPLFVRRFSDSLPRGSAQRHWSGRILIPTDNTPAHWAYRQAWSGRKLDAPGVASLLARDEIPIAMMLKSTEKSRARYRHSGRSGLLNESGWKLCHIEPVKVGRGDVRTRPVTEIEQQFRRFMHPRNMFVIPLRLGGLGEVREIIDALR